MDTVIEGTTRLESVKEAILEELSRMKFQSEKGKIGLVTFGSEVKFQGTKNSSTLIPNASYHQLSNVLAEATKVK